MRRYITLHQTNLIILCRKSPVEMYPSTCCRYMQTENTIQSSVFDFFFITHEYILFDGMSVYKTGR